MGKSVAYGDIWFVEFEPSIGHEFNGKRPAVVIQSDLQLAKSNLITVAAITSRVDKSHEDDIFIAKDAINSLFCDSLIKIHNIESFDYCRFIKKIGRADDAVMGQIKKYLLRHFGLTRPI